MKIPLSNLDLSDLEIKYAKDALDSGWISASGKYVQKASEAWAEFCGVNYCTLVTNGTAALHLALMIIGIQPGDEVIVPGMTFVSPAAVVSRISGVPIIADIEEISWCINPKCIEPLITEKTKAVIAVDVLGHPVESDKIRKICDKYNIFFIEDAAEAHGSSINGKKTGSFGDISTFSFFANKTFGCGEGGALVTNDKSFFKKAELLKNHGMTKERPYWHEFIGDNFRLTNISAAILLGQIERAEEIISKRKRVSKFYRQELRNINNIHLRPKKENIDMVPWIEVLRVYPQANISRDNFVENLRNNGIDARALWTAIIDLPPYSKINNARNIETPLSKEILSQVLWLPTASNMSEKELKFVTNKIKEILRF